MCRKKLQIHVEKSSWNCTQWTERAIGKRRKHTHSYWLSVQCSASPNSTSQFAFHFHADRCFFHWCVWCQVQHILSSFFLVSMFFSFRIWKKQKENERTSLIAKYVKYPDWNMPNTAYRIKIGLSLFLRTLCLCLLLSSMEQVNNKKNWTKKCACVCVYILVGTQSTNAWITIFDPKKRAAHRKYQPAKESAPHTKQQKFTLYIWWRRQTKA